MSLLGRESPDERDERLGGSRMTTGPSTKEENIYIPQFITKRPFYAIDEEDEPSPAGGRSEGSTSVSKGSTRDYLEHQRLRKAEEETKWYQRGRKAGPAATKYRKGACENCGSMGHKMRDCLSRPRAKLAKHSGEDIQADDIVQDVKLSWDAKRDRWLGFDARDYASVVAQREKMNEARRLLQEKASGKDLASSGNGDEDTRYAEDADMGVSRTNGAADLRMREDTARYLINLDVDSAQYDPKRRKIVSGGAFLDESARLFDEQNFAKASGEAAAFEKAERYAWEVHDQTGDASLHVQANPTAAAHRRRLDEEDAGKKQKELDALIQEKYGISPSQDSEAIEGGAKPQSVATRLATTVAASEHFMEYDETGHVKEKPQGRQSNKSKYEEDVFPMNHTSVWGSWWNDFRWGYACCHSFVRNSYCTGEEGKAAWEQAEQKRLGNWQGSFLGKENGEGERKRLTA